MIYFYSKCHSRMEYHKISIILFLFQFRHLICQKKYLYKISVVNIYAITVCTLFEIVKMAVSKAIRNYKDGKG